MTEIDKQDLLEMSADIVSAFVSNNAVHAGDLPELIKTVHASLTGLMHPKPEAVKPETLSPAVPIKKSVTDDYLICLEDGKHFKSLKRHLQTAYDMTPDQYRAKWGLSRDYPMVAPGYAAHRSELAKASGLGNARRKPSETVSPVASIQVPSADSVVAQTPAKRRGRPAKRAA